MIGMGYIPHASQHDTLPQVVHNGAVFIESQVKSKPKKTVAAALDFVLDF